MIIRLRIKEILEEKGKYNYWLSQHLGMCYRNYLNIVPIGELFEQTEETSNE